MTLKHFTHYGTDWEFENFIDLMLENIQQLLKL